MGLSHSEAAFKGKICNLPLEAASFHFRLYRNKKFALHLGYEKCLVQTAG